MIEVKAVGDIGKLNIDRETVLNKYKDIKRRWNKNLKHIYPDRFKEICKIIEGLENGEEFKIVNSQSEQLSMIAGVGSLFGKQEVLHSVDNHIK